MNLSSDVATPALRPTPPKRKPRAALEHPPQSPPRPSGPAAALLLEDLAALPEATEEDRRTRLAGRVRFARMLAGLSKADLAREVGVCLSAAVQWELPKGTSPNVTNLIRIATATNVGFEWLATGRSSPKLADDMLACVKPEDLEFEAALVVAARTIPPSARDTVLVFLRSLGEPAP